MADLKSFLSRKWKLLTLLLVLLLLAGILLYFWHVTHLSGPSPVWMIPKANQNGVGGTVTLSSESIYKEGAVLLYVYNPDAGTHRVAIFQDATDFRGSVTCVTVWEPHSLLEEGWESPDDFLDALAGGFKAMLISRTNIDSYERMILNNATYMSEEKESKLFPHEIRSADTFGLTGTGNDVQYYLCRLADIQADAGNAYFPLNDTFRISVMANTLNGCSEEFSRSVNVFMRTIDRFKLRDELGISHK